MRRKVYKGQLFKKGEHEPRNVYIAANNRKQVAEVVGCSLYHVQRYFLNTGYNFFHKLSAQAYKNPLTIVWDEPIYKSNRPFPKIGE